MLPCLSLSDFLWLPSNNNCNSFYIKYWSSWIVPLLKLRGNLRDKLVEILIHFYVLCGSLSLCWDRWNQAPEGVCTIIYCHIAICIHPVLDTSRFPDTDGAQREGLRVSDAEATTVCQIVTKSAHLLLNGESHMAWSVLPSPLCPLTGSLLSHHPWL